MVLAAVSTIREGFTSLPHHDGEPTYAAIVARRTNLRANLTTIPDDQSGHLGMLFHGLEPAAFKLLAGFPYIVPAQPAPTAPGINGRSAAQVALDNAIRSEQERVYKHFTNAGAAAKQEIIESFDAIYLKELWDPTTGYSAHSALQIIDHLLTRYGNITPTQSIENDVFFHQKIDLSQPFATHTARWEECRDFSNDNNAGYTNEQMCNNAYNLLSRTGHFRRECQAWTARPIIEKTWANFKTHFNNAYRDLRTFQAETSQQGYHGANAAIEGEDEIEQIFHETVANLAAESSASAQLQVSQAQAISSLTQQMTALTQSITTMARNQGLPAPALPAAAILPAANAGGGRGNGGRGDRGGRGRGGRGGRDNYQRVVRTERWYHNDNYCHSHGYDVDPRHTSLTCRFRKPGHIETATKSNPQGGCQDHAALVA